MLEARSRRLEATTSAELFRDASRYDERRRRTAEGGKADLRLGTNKLRRFFFLLDVEMFLAAPGAFAEYQPTY